MINMDVQPSVVRLTETDKSGLVMKKSVVTQAKLENNVRKFFSALTDVQPWLLHISKRSANKKSIMSIDKI